MKHLSQDDLVLQFYGEAGTKFERHLRECNECRSRFGLLKQVLESIEPPVAPALATDYAQSTWGCIRNRLAEPEPEPRKHRWSWGWSRSLGRSWGRSWIPAAAMALLIVAAFVIGRHFPTTANNAPAIQATNTAAQRERILLVALSDHLDRSQVLLLELRHAPNGNELAVHRESAEELIASNRLYRQAALRGGDETTVAVLDELERLLLDVAHADANSTDLQAIRDRIDSEGLLFKVRVVDSNLKRQVSSERRAGATDGSENKGPKI
jgi:hypothetical protein